MIKLTKGQRINIKKGNGSTLDNICVGVNWGAIVTKGFFGSKTTAVDLDASIGVYDEAGELIDLVSYRGGTSPGITAADDDREGDTDGDDGLDNEVIQIKLSALHPRAASLGLVLNSFNRIDFKDIPFASARIYSGTPTRVDEVHAQLDIANDPKFAGAICMILGVFYKKEGEWKFRAIGEPTKDNTLDELIETTAKQYAS